MVVGQVEAPQAGKSENGREEAKGRQRWGSLEPGRRRRVIAPFGDAVRSLCLGSNSGAQRLCGSC